MTTVEPRKMLYCNICTMPPEYCEFSGTQEKCKEWLRENHKSKFESLYGEQVVDQIEHLTLDDTSEAGKSDRTIVKDKSAKLEAKLEKEIKKKEAARVTIKRVERTKRKRNTTIHGLEVFGVDLKKAAKMFANRFACGSSVAKNNQCQDEIVVQGDFSDEIRELILQNWPDVKNIDLIIEEKKSK